jgi:hypothetical protein
MKSWGQYHLYLLAQAVKKTLYVLGFSQPINLIRSSVAWGIGVWVLVELDSSLLPNELTLWVSAVISFFVFCIITFVYEWCLQGYILYKEKLEIIEELQREFRKIEQTEDILKGLSDLYFSGRTKFEQGFHNNESKEEWLSTMENWSQEVRVYIERHLNVSALHSFLGARNGWFNTDGNFENNFASSSDHLMDQQRYNAKLDFINEYISFNSSSWRNDIETVKVDYLA